jgi:hypothetical protein
VSAAPTTPGRIDEAKVQREHRRLLRRWAFGVATKAEILRCIELDRREHWLANRSAKFAAKSQGGIAARAALGGAK